MLSIVVHLTEIKSLLHSIIIYICFKLHKHQTATTFPLNISWIQSFILPTAELLKYDNFVIFVPTSVPEVLLFKEQNIDVVCPRVEKQARHFGNFETQKHGTQYFRKRNRFWNKTKLSIGAIFPQLYCHINIPDQ